MSEIIRVRDAITRPANTTQYAVGDALSEVTTNDHYTISAFARRAKESGIIRTATVMCSANNATKADLTLLLFYTDIAETADNSASTLTDAEHLTMFAAIDFPTTAWMGGNPASGADGNAMACLNNLNLAYQLPSGTTNVYGQLILQNTYTPVESEVFTVDLVLERF